MNPLRLLSRPVIRSRMALAMAVGLFSASAWHAVDSADSGRQAAQRNESAAISVLRSKDAQIDRFRAEVYALLAATTADERARVAAQFSRVAARPSPPAGAAPARGSGPAPSSTTTTTRPAPAPAPPGRPAPPPPKPAPCVTVPVIGGCLP